jgi:Bacterial SH3 domain
MLNLASVHVALRPVGWAPRCPGYGQPGKLSPSLIASALVDAIWINDARGTRDDLFYGSDCMKFSALTRAIAAALSFPTVLVLASLTTTHIPHFAAEAIAAESVSEKDAFEAAKDLGTADAWNAFLKSFPSGFHADLARAYLKKIDDGGASTPAPSPRPQAAAEEFPQSAASWGGVVRDGPGRQYKQIGSLNENEPVTLVARTDVVENGYPWFKILYRDGKSGFKWGGILCSTGDERPDLFKTCQADAHQTPGSDGQDEDDAEDRKAKPKKKCPRGMYRNQNGVCQPNETGG